jgi:fatty-acyl-CoA synthase
MLDAVKEVAQFGVLAGEALYGSGFLGTLRARAVATYVAQALRRRRDPSRLLSFHALNTPDKEALVDGPRRFTYREIDERVDRLAAALLAEGMRPGDRLAVMLKNSHAYLECQWAATRAAAYVVQIGYRLKPSEVAYILGNSEPRVLVCGVGEEPIVREAVASGGWRGRVVVVGPEYEALIAAAQPGAAGAMREKPEERGGVVIYTSGTTGKPKGASRSFQKTTHPAVADFLRQLHLRHDDRHLVVCPLYHSAAPALVMFHLMVGATIVLADHFEPEATLALIDRERITTSFMVPTMLGRLAAAAGGERRASSLRMLASGAAPLPTETARRVEAAFGRILYNFYGATETGLVTLALPGEHTGRPGTIGRALAGNEIRLYGDDGRVVGPGEVGELYVRNSMLVEGYHRDPGATSRAMRDGFFSVGDMARVDRDGYYFLADRKTDMVISGGVNIYPLEIEQRLHAHPAVQEAAVIGVPDEEWGESLKAFIVLRPDAEAGADELRAFCKETLANFKAPKHFQFLDALPRNPTGKVLKRELRGR